MLTSPLVRLLLASFVGLIAAGVIIGIAISLDSAFFADKPRLQATPCYFTAPAPSAAGAEPASGDAGIECLQAADENGVVRFFNSFLKNSNPSATPLQLERSPSSDRRP